MDSRDKQVINDVKQYGWHIIKVMADEEGPSFAFSIGLNHTFKHAEVIVFGLDLDIMHQIINEIGDQVKKGKMFKSGKRAADILDGYNCSFRNVAKRHYPEYLGYAMWYYKGDDFPVVQCIWPDKGGAFPWDKGFSSDLLELQPVLEK